MTKRILTLLLALALVCALLPVTLASATTYYNLWVGGNRVTSENITDILGNGLFSYNSAENKLTVKGSYTYSAENGKLIDNEINGLTIDVAQNAVLRASNGCPIWTNMPLTITGPGKLTAIGKFYGIKAINGATVTLDTIDLDATATGTEQSVAISGGPQWRETLVIRNCFVHAKGAQAAVSGFSSISLVNCQITAPTNGQVNSGQITYDNGAAAPEVTIGGEYDLTIAGTQVTALNAPDVLGNGVFAYDSETKTLTVQGSFDCEALRKTMIENRISGLKIVVAEDVTLKAFNPVIWTYADLTISGPGKLTGVSRASVIIAYSGAKITVKDANLELSGYCGIKGYPDGERLIVNNSSIHAVGEDGAIRDFDGGISLANGVEILFPAGGSRVNGSVVNANGSIANEVWLGEKYNLWIAGTQVTSANADYILGTSSFSYDAANKTLTVRGNQSSGEDPVIRSRIKGLTIYVAQDALLSASQSVIVAKYDTVITGPGTLSLISGYNPGIYLENGANLTLEDLTLNVAGLNGFYSEGTSDLIVRRSDVYAIGTNAAFQGFDSIQLEDCSVTLPKNSNNLYGQILDENGSDAKEVRIATKFDLWVAGTQVSYANKDDVLGDGKFSYYPEFNRLDVKDTHVLVTNDNIIKNAVPGLTISIVDDLTLDADRVPIWISADTTIIGPGELSLGSYFANIYVENGATLTIDTATVNVFRGKGLVGANTGEKLVIRCSNFFVEGLGYAIDWFDAGIVLIGCQVTVPEAGYPGPQSILDQTGALATNVTISLVNPPFVDVPEGNEYFNAVQWAYCHQPHQVTAGMDATHFGPDLTVNRAQAMVFFWAAQDKPEPTATENPFTDVKAGKYYYKAVLWAVEHGITAGTDATHFSPNKTCNRSEILQFFYASVGKPGYTISNPYTDVKDKNWYKDGAIWAYENGLERGENREFKAKTPCTRAATVLYLYRFLTGLELAQ